MRIIPRTHDLQHVRLTLEYPNQLSYTDVKGIKNLLIEFHILFNEIFLLLGQYDLNTLSFRALKLSLKSRHLKGV